MGMTSSLDQLGRDAQTLKKRFNPNGGLPANHNRFAVSSSSLVSSVEYAKPEEIARIVNRPAQIRNDMKLIEEGHIAAYRREVEAIRARMGNRPEDELNKFHHPTRLNDIGEADEGPMILSRREAERRAQRQTHQIEAKRIAEDRILAQRIKARDRMRQQAVEQTRRMRSNQSVAAFRGSA